VFLEEEEVDAVQSAEVVVGGVDELIVFALHVLHVKDYN
jgi:hypothetical protein